MWRDARGAAAIVHDEAPDNVLLSRRFDHGDVEAALASSAAVVERVFRTNRQTAAPLEGRGGVADWNAAEGKLTLYSGTQVPHLARHALAEILGCPRTACGSSPPTSAAASASRPSSIPRTSCSACSPCAWSGR